MVGSLRHNGQGKLKSALSRGVSIGHETSALKNLALIGPALYLVFAGARPPMLIGFGSDWRLDGLLLQLY